MGSHTILIEARIGGVWTDVSDEIRQGSLKLSRGLTEIGRIKPAAAAWTFDDPTDKWRPGNPTSVIYGQAGRAMPVRITVDGSVQGYAEATGFQPDRSEGFNPGPPVRGDQWVEFTGAGILERINSWEEPVRSPMYRMITGRTTMIGHWPMEDGRDAGQLTNTYPGGSPGLAQVVSFEQDECPDGAASAVKLDELSSRIGGNFSASASTTAGWQFAWSMKLAAMPSSGSYLQMVSWRTSNGYRWTVDVNDTSYRFRVTASDGTLLEDTGTLHSPDFGEPDNWITFRMKATASGGTVTAEFAWYVQQQSVPWGTTGTFSGTLGRLVSWSANGNAYLDEALFSHVFGVEGGSDDLLAYAVQRAFDGYVGETAGDRFKRLLTEAGVDWSVVGDPAETMPMGRQPIISLPDHLKEIASTDRCLIYDDKHSNAIELRTREDLYLQTPVEIPWSTGIATPTGIASPFRETYDNVGVANWVTASQRGGGEATEVLDSGPMSIQASPDGIGIRKGSIDVNVNDPLQLQNLAGWELSQGTLEGPRFPTLIIDLDAAPSLTTAVNAIDIGDRVVVTGLREFDIDLLVLHISQSPRDDRRKVTFTCIPGDVYSQVGIYDDDDRRIDSSSTTLGADRDATQTSWTFSTDLEGDTWDTSQEPYNVICGGEVMTVTSMGAVSGSGPYTQTATVTRSVNGVVKSHSAGDRIEAHNAARWAL